MAQYYQIHPTHPQERLVNKAAAIVNNGGIIVYPTDSCYALGCHIGEKEAMERIRRIRQLSEKHLFTMMCSDLSAATRWAKVENWVYRSVKSATPGPYTFLLPATREVPRRLLNPKRRIIGIRIPDNIIAQALLQNLKEPIMTTTLIMPGDDMPLSDPEDMHDRLQQQVDLIIDGGQVGIDLTTVVDLTGQAPQILRIGKGDTTPFA